MEKIKANVRQRLVEGRTDILAGLVVEFRGTDPDDIHLLEKILRGKRTVIKSGNKNVIITS